MAGDKPVVLDTSALFCLRDDEPGAEEVARLLERRGNVPPAYVSFASLTEYFYVIYQEEGAEEARRAYLELKMLPLEIIESSETLRLLAGELKALFSLSFADAWIAATAEFLNAPLVHKDPDFEVLSKRISLKPLPYKTRKE